ncbi:MAG: hypothetical protein WC054_04035 [Candidatus Nanopelagicales bacterium]
MPAQPIIALDFDGVINCSFDQTSNPDWTSFVLINVDDHAINPIDTEDGQQLTKVEALSLIAVADGRYGTGTSDKMLNVLTRQGLEDGPFYTRHHSDDPQHEFFAPGRIGAPTIITYHPQHVEFIHQLLADEVPIMWATSWESAILPVARIIGLPEMPVLKLGECAGPLLHSATSVDWKLSAIGNAIPRQPVIWIDDVASGQARDNISVVATNSRLGLDKEAQQQTHDLIRNLREGARK